MPKYSVLLWVNGVVLATSDRHKTLAAAQGVASGIAQLAGSCFSPEVLSQADIEIEDQRGRLMMLIPVSHVLYAANSIDIGQTFREAEQDQSAGSGTTYRTIPVGLHPQVLPPPPPLG